MSTPSLIEGSRTYVAGKWVDAEATFAVENPADESVVAEAGPTTRRTNRGPTG